MDIITIATVLLLTISGPEGRIDIQRTFSSPAACAATLTTEFVAATDAELWVSGGCFVSGQEA